MQLERIAGLAFDHIFGRILRRALLALIVAAFAITAIYHFAVAGILTLEVQYGALHTQWIVAAIFTALALIAYVILWAMRSKMDSPSAPVLSGQRETQIVMLVEAVMLGYALARKGPRTR